MIKMPKETGREYRPLDWYGWFMSIFGLALMCKFGGVGWIFGEDHNWWMLAAMGFMFWEYAIRVAFGRVYKFVYYDTLIHPMYELEINGKQFFVSAETEEELALYMKYHYPDMEYNVLNEVFTESFIKTDRYL
jgi:hypothetical protein